MREQDTQDTDHSPMTERRARIEELRKDSTTTNEQILSLLGISRRTFYRDVSVLTEAGVITPRKQPSSLVAKSIPRPRQESLERDQEILSHLRANPTITNQELMINFFISSNTLHRSLQRLRAAGEIIDRPRTGIGTKRQDKIQSRDEKIADLRKKGFTNLQILIKLDEDITIGTVANAVKRLVDAGVIKQRRGKSLTSTKSEYLLEDIEDPEKYGQIVADLRNRGLTNQEIVDKTGRSHATLHRTLRRLIKAGKTTSHDNGGRLID